MHETSAPTKDLASETKRRLRRAEVFARAAELGAHTHKDRWELMGLSRPTYWRLLNRAGSHLRLDTAKRVLNGLKWTDIDQAFEEVA
jgi:hypothetical protein